MTVGPPNDISAGTGFVVPDEDHGKTLGERTEDLFEKVRRPSVFLQVQNQTLHNVVAIDSDLVSAVGRTDGALCEATALTR